MKIKKQRYLSGLLAITMLLGQVPITTLAIETETSQREVSTSKNDAETSKLRSNINTGETTNLLNLFPTPLGNAVVSGNQVVLTDPSKQSQIGGMWTKDKITLKRSWTFSGKVQANDAGVFIALQSFSNQYLGEPGGANGLYYGGENQPPMIVGEFDYFNNIVMPSDGYQFADNDTNEMNIITMYDKGNKAPGAPGVNYTKSPVEIMSSNVQKEMLPVSVRWDASERTFTMTLFDTDRTKIIQQQYTAEQLNTLFGTSLEAYLGFTGAIGIYPGYNRFEFSKFTYDGYSLNTKMEINKVKDGSAITAENPVHKNDWIHVTEHLTNPVNSKDSFDITYKTGVLKNLDAASIKNFKVNDVLNTNSPANGEIPLLGFSYANPYKIEFDIQAKQLTGVFDEVSGTNNISYSSVVTSELEGETVTSAEGPTKNDAPVITGASNFTIDYGTVLTDEICKTKANLIYSDTEDATENLKVKADFSKVNTKVKGNYEVNFTVTDADGKVSAIKTVTVTVEPKILTELTIKFVDKENQDVVTPFKISGNFEVGGDPYNLLTNPDITAKKEYIENSLHRHVQPLEQESAYPVPESGVVTYLVDSQVKTNITVKFVDENNQQMGEVITIPEQVVGSSINLYENTTFKSRYDTYKANYYDVAFDPSYKVEANQVITVRVYGKVVFKSAPDVDFKTIDYSTSTQRVNNPELVGGKKLEVVNTRANKGNWRLKAQTTKELTNGKTTINGALRYNSPTGGQDQSLTVGAEVLNQDSGEGVVISDTWKDTADSTGLKLVIDPTANTITTGDYTGEIKWTLEATY